MLKKISFMIALIVTTLIVNVSLANVTPTQKSQVFINKIEKKIDIIAETNFEKLWIILKKINLLNNKTKNQELKYIISEIINYINDVISRYETNELNNIFNEATSPVRVWIQTIAKWLRPTYEKLWSFYLLRIKPEVIWTPKNLVIQTYFNHGWCLELAKNNLPEDFTFLSTDWWKTRRSIKDTPETLWLEISKDGINYPLNNKILCGAFHIKVVYPKDWQIFDDWIAFPILNRWHDYEENNRCLEFTISADNAQYTNNQFCRKK